MARSFLSNHSPCLWRGAVSVVTAAAVMLAPAAAQSPRAQLEPAVRQALRQALLQQLDSDLYRLPADAGRWQWAGLRRR